MKIKWVGFDYGQCIMDSRNRKVEYWMAAVFIDEEGERGGTIDGKVKLYRQLIEKYGSYPRLQEKGRDEIHSIILENNPCLIRKYYEVEQKLLKPAVGVEEALRYLKSKGYVLHIVSDMGTGFSLQAIQRFLNNHGLRYFFTRIYSPAGIIREDGNLDERFRGVNKEDGSIYDLVKAELGEMGIDVSEAAMIGDNPVKDILQAKKRGFVTIHYSPSGEGSEHADHVITNFLQLKEIF